MRIFKRKLLILISLIVLIIILVDSLWIERFFIETNEFYLGAATKSSKNIKIIQLSDLHLQKLNRQLIDLTKKINQLKPDLIVVTGDAIDKSGNLTLLSHFLNLIDRKIQKAAILGNWEYWSNVDLDSLSDIYKANNCILLINRTVQFTFQNKTISVTGIDDFLNGNPDYEAALKGYTHSDYHLILNHCPQYNDSIIPFIDTTISVDIILSGHTHGGQFNVLGFVPFLPRGSGNYISGWYKRNNTKIYVSKGIGTSDFPTRFGARSEIAIFNLL